MPVSEFINKWFSFCHNMHNRSNSTSDHFKLYPGGGLTTISLTSAFLRSQTHTSIIPPKSAYAGWSPEAWLLNRGSAMHLVSGTRSLLSTSHDGRSPVFWGYWEEHMADWSAVFKAQRNFIWTLGRRSELPCYFYCRANTKQILCLWECWQQPRRHIRKTWEELIRCYVELVSHVLTWLCIIEHFKYHKE